MRTTPAVKRLGATLVIATCSLSLTVPSQAAPSHPSVVAMQRSTQSDSQQIREAARTAAQHHRDKGKNKHRPSDPAVVGLESALDKVVADGAIGITAELESPTLRWSGASGLRDKDGRQQARPDDRFRGASNTKMMVATLVLQQVQQGTWSLDTTINSIIPELLPGHDDVTLRQVLSHTSGMPYGTSELLMRNMTDPSSLDDLQAAISRDYTPQDHVDAINAGTWTTPGEFVYSNAGYVVLGMVLEAQTGRHLDQLMRQGIWKPARMDDTYVATDPGLRGHALHEDAYLGADQWLELDGFDPDIFLSAGSIVTTADDLNQFTKALVTGRLLRPDLVRLMETPVDVPAQYGLGLLRIPDPCDATGQSFLYGHDGASYGTLSIALTSADGRRQYSIGATGRDVSQVNGRWSPGDALVPMFEASCSAS